jgi:6-pyruvoyltetrahydropterin/6-carboxytetrahydropterin synthase
VSYRVTVSARFEAAHSLTDSAGGPEPLHGHSYKVEIVFEAETLGRHGLAVDFAAAKKALDTVAKEFDDTDLNEHPAFAGPNTSAENLVRHFAEGVEASGTLGKAQLAEATVWEGPENRATHRSGGKLDIQGLIDNPSLNP